jgi:hypothetical protein
MSHRSYYRMESQPFRVVRWEPWRGGCSNQVMAENNADARAAMFAIFCRFLDPPSWASCVLCFSTELKKTQSSASSCCWNWNS